MLERILEKLGAKSMDEFWENEKKIRDKYKGLGIERKSLLLKLSDEEMDFLLENGYIGK